VSSTPQSTMPITCPSCQQQFQAGVESVIDAGHDPAAKARFLSGQANRLECPNCGAQFSIAVPLVYHDHTKELLMTYVPQEFNLDQQQRQGIIGEMTRAIMEAVPQEQRKGYMLNPIEPLTLQGMMETILEKDGITREMMQAQREKANLVQRFIEVDESMLESMIADHDDEMDEEFFQLMIMQADQLLASGQQAIAQQFVDRRDLLLQKTTYGQQVLAKAEQQQAIVEQVAQDIQKIQQQGGLEADAFIDFLLGYGGSDDHIQAVVGLVRQVFTYDFFLHLSNRIDSASGEEKQQLELLHNRLSALTQSIDQQQQQAVQQIQQILQAMMAANDLDDIIDQFMPVIDDMFLSVLSATMEAAQNRNDLMASTRLKNIYNKIIERLQASAPPEARFVSQLLEEDDDIEARLMVAERSQEFGQPLIDYLDAVIGNLSQRQDDGVQPILEKLESYRAAAEKAING